MKGMMCAVGLAAILCSCSSRRTDDLLPSSGGGATGPTGSSVQQALGDAKLGPIEIERVRVRPLSGVSVGFYAEPGGSYTVAPKAQMEVWIEWTSLTPLATPPRLVIDWGDGVADNIHCGPCRLEHAYERGEYLVKVLMDDRVGGTTRRTFTFVARDNDPSQIQERTFTFSNSAPIYVPFDAGCAETPALTYPAAISVSGVPGTITKATVTFNGFSTQNLDMLALLVAPNGRTVKLLDEAGGAGPIVNADLAFDDAAPSCCGALGPGPVTRKPSTSLNDSPLLPPAPNIADGLTLSTLNGSPANGSWQLFLQSHLICASGQGELSGGWSLTLTTKAQ